MPILISKGNQFLIMLWLFIVIIGGVIAKQGELGEEPDYYPKVNPNPNNVEELTINDIPIYFDMFNRFYEIDYKDDAHLNRSYETFKDNVKRIIIMNKFSTAAKFAINEFAHLTLEEFTDKYTGFNDTGMDDKNVNIFTYNSTQGAPRNLDWRALGLPPLVRHQGPCKSSYVFSTIANIEAQIAKNFKKTMRLSDQQAYDCEPTGTCKYGGLPHKVMEAIMQIGGLEEQIKYIYDPKDQRECKAKEEHMVVAVKGIQLVKPQFENGLIALLALYGPIVTNMYVSESVKNYYRGVLWPTDCDKKPNHAVLLVGYGITADSVPYWIIKNSWGMMWGEAGYIRLIRGEHACNIGQYVATATVELIDRSNVSIPTEELTPFQRNVSGVLDSLSSVSKTEHRTSQEHHKKSKNDRARKENDKKTVTSASKLARKDVNDESEPLESELARQEVNDDSKPRKSNLPRQDLNDSDPIKSKPARLDVNDDNEPVNDDTNEADNGDEGKDNDDDDQVGDDDDGSDSDKDKRNVNPRKRKKQLQRADQESSADTQDEFKEKYKVKKKRKDRRNKETKLKKQVKKKEEDNFGKTSSGDNDDSDYDNAGPPRITQGFY